MQENIFESFLFPSAFATWLVILLQYVGSDAASFFFNIFINDFQQAVNNKLMESADDTKEILNHQWEYCCHKKALTEVKNKDSQEGCNQRNTS